MKRKRLLAWILCLCAAFSLLSAAALADSTESFGGRASVTTTTDAYGNVCVAGYTVPAELFYYAYYKSGATEKEYSFRGGAFNSNSAESPVKAYSPAERLTVPMICVWDYEEPPADGYPSGISASGGFVAGAANEHSDSWLITNLQTGFLPVYDDRAAFTELVLPMSLERIGKNAVQDCARLTSVSFYDLENSRLETIDEQAFLSCPLLSGIELPDTLATIGTEAFLNCPSLISITVPNSVTSIRQHALGYTTQDGNSYDKVPGFVIRGYKGSEAQTYAERCGFTFIAIDGTEEEGWQGAGVVSIDNFSSMPQAVYTPGQFTDVDENVWYGANGEKAIQTAFELRIVNGKGDGVFDPNGSVLLCEAIKMAAVVHSIYCGGNGELNARSGETWFEPYVNYCVEQGVIAEGDFSREYTRPATRAEMAYIFANTLPYSEMQTINDVTELPDVTSATPYYEDILTMYRCGALKGNDAYGTFTPNSNITRAAAAAIISRIALREQRQTFTLETKQAQTVGSYTPYMWVKDLDTLEKIYKERVWGLYTDMYVYMDVELSDTLFASDYYHDWVPFAANVSTSYNENNDSLMAYTLSDYSLDFELDAVLEDASVSARASAEAKSYLAKIDSLLASLSLGGKSEREKLLAIHDWMVANVAYDMDYAEASFKFNGPLDHGKAVCQGYAELFYYLASRSGIECYTVTGMASSGAGRTDWEGHAWNVVYLAGDDTPYFIDVTYDDPVPDTTTGRHDYFMVTEKKLSADHQW